jgi:hypothetical protein
VSEREREELLQERGTTARDRQTGKHRRVGWGESEREREQVIMQPLLAMTVHVWVHVHVRASVRVASL